MNRKSKELKRFARETLNQKYQVPMTALFLTTLLSFVMELPFSLTLGDYPTLSQYMIIYAAEFFISLIVVVLNAGQAYIHLNLSREKEVAVKQLFYAFSHHPERYIGAGFLTMLLSFVGLLPFFGAALYFYFTELSTVSVLLLVLGGILSLILNVYFLLTYGMVTYLLLDYPEMKVLRAFRESRLMVKGHKGRYLYLSLSFLGWYLLILCSFGVASLWIIPYQNQTLITFYLDLTSELDHRQVNFSNATV